MLAKYEPYQAEDILVKSDSSISSFYSSPYVINPYRGCEVGCRYCYVQEKKFNDSAAFEEDRKHIVQVKINAPFLLKQKLQAGLEPSLITIGESCEPFSAAEDRFFVTQRILEILGNHDFPVHIITRFPRVLRDIEILKKINSNSFACITVSIPVISSTFIKKLEGNTPEVKERLRIISTLKKNGLSAGVAVSPVFPILYDENRIIKILKKAFNAGASYVLFSPLKIKDYQRGMIFSWVSEKYPDILEDFKNLYENGEYPEAVYWNKNLKILKQRALEIGLTASMPIETEASQQEFSDLSSYA